MNHAVRSLDVRRDNLSLTFVEGGTVNGNRISIEQLDLGGSHNRGGVPSALSHVVQENVREVRSVEELLRGDIELIAGLAAVISLVTLALGFRLRAEDAEGDPQARMDTAA